jgi:predicted extracellular nuclease
VYVLAHGSAGPQIQAVADQIETGSWYNGDDAVVLTRGAEVVDVVGQVGVDPGSQWGGGLDGTQNNTLRRKSNVCLGSAGDNAPFDPARQWRGVGMDVFTGLGAHSVHCGAADAPASATLIHDVQGSGMSSPLTDRTVSVEAVVTGVFQGADRLSGFFIQEEDADADNNPLTSEGLFVYQGASGTKVNAGDLVRVRGRVKEFYGLTELSRVSVKILGHGQPLPAPTDIVLPLSAGTGLERYEGMYVRVPQRLTVTETYNLGRYAEVWLSSGARLMQPTAVAPPGPKALELQAANDLNRLLLDDGSAVRNPDPIIYPPPALSAARTLRLGDTLANITGIIDHTRGNYRLQPVTLPDYQSGNPRPSASVHAKGFMKIASFNVLNYFNGNGRGGGFPAPRGANSAKEFQRQRNKLIAAIMAMDADIIGLMELENDGFGAHSAIQDLVNGLNAATPERARYAFIDPGTARIGDDDITVGIVYRAQTVKPRGQAAVLDGRVDPRFDDGKNRPVLAQTFDHTGTGNRLTVAVGHLKSKGSSCADVNDPDTGDGQGNCNKTRTNAARALTGWLATDPTQSGDADFLILGDMNAYAKEDPLTVFKNAGYTDLIDAHIGAGRAYTFVFAGQAGYLDHALASESLTGQVTGITLWHINADEPRALDYNTEFKSAGQINRLYKPDVYRASDHDPVIVHIGSPAESAAADNLKSHGK